MTLHVLVAEPSDDHWTSISAGIRHYRSDASILRVKDGEQAARFLFYKGQFSDEPETPGLVVLSADLALVPAEAIIARLRQRPETPTTPVIVVCRDNGQNVDLGPELKRSRWLQGQQSLLIVGVNAVASEVTEAVRQLCRDLL